MPVNLGRLGNATAIWLGVRVVTALYVVKRHEESSTFYD